MILTSKLHCKVFYARSRMTKGSLFMRELTGGRPELDAFVKRLLCGSFSKIFCVDINTGEFTVYKHDGLLNDEGFEDITNVYAYIRKLIADRIVYPEYATAFRRFTNPAYVCKCIFSGDLRIVQSYRRRTSHGDMWITFAVIAPPDCTPENPMALFTWREADSDAITLLDTLPTISSLYDKLIRLNLTNNTYEPVLLDDAEQERLAGGVLDLQGWWESYSRNGNIAEEDMDAFTTITETDGLQKHFAHDLAPISFRYRRKVGNELRWMQLQIAPSVEYSEANQILLLSLKDVHEEYTAEIRSRQELIDSMSRDGLTNLFNRLKFNADNEILGRSGSPLFTCLYIDVNGLHELNNLLGHQKGDDMLCRVADSLREHFPDESIYRIGGDEFVVTSTRLTKPEVELLVENVRYDLSEDNYEISVGVATGTCTESIEKTVTAAESNMRSDKAAYYTRNGDRRKKRQMNEELEQMLIAKNDSERFLHVIAHQFSSVFFVDLARDTLRHIYIPDFFKELLEKNNDSFLGAMQQYIRELVKPAYHDRFDDILDPRKLNRRLAAAPIQIAYEKTDGIRINLHIIPVEAQQPNHSESLWIFEKDNP